ncbi:DUF4865 family protein, partial [Streptomyces sp. NPDC052676]|uniref:DUF4865 family protein n=1 Tax=Streptomyces sp. NPDC052676 TaxID=3154953 RepID=UPI0034446A32
MHAMQYEITLPADYDMDVVRARVARVGHALDDWEGLGFKAYLTRERGVWGSPVNQYAPFYLWNTVRGMNSFLWGGGFRRRGSRRSSASPSRGCFPARRRRCPLAPRTGRC